ncbi:hypothetical protein DSCO28_41820 [Desulfosarcina ovata subsp. sediminis]|uniref:Uncharacterized protein n=1 Tax=Desulfosarcina ovata subsp. sediminis TaxID=885957 RepID=A0A5K7ZTR2_9BACT|nr:hypothetical protein DSCO28_41820 [Desulfosarcina ovata subsp. sediminis]
MSIKNPGIQFGRALLADAMADIGSEMLMEIACRRLPLAGFVTQFVAMGADHNRPMCYVPWAFPSPPPTDRSVTA